MQQTENGVDSEAAAVFVRESVAQATPFLFNAVGALLVLIVGLWIAGRIKRLIAAGLGKSRRMDEMLVGFLSSLAYYGLVALVVITTLGVFGVPTTSFAALIGAAGLAIGLALQGTLGHIASGVMMLAFRPFRVGDYVETGGFEGTVKAVTLFMTELSTLDNRKVIIPNGKVWDSPVVNYSSHSTRRIDIIFGVSYSDDLDKALAAVREEVDAEERILREPAPLIVVDSLGDSSVNILCRFWAAPADLFPVKWALTKAVKERFDTVGVTIPFPTRQIVQSAS